MKFNLSFCVGDTVVAFFENTTIIGCNSVSDVRSWLNESHRFINIGDRIINLDNITHIKVW